MEQKKLEESKIASEDFVDFIVEYNRTLVQLSAENPDIIIGHRFPTDLAVVYAKRTLADSIINQLTVISNLSYPLLFNISDDAALNESNILPIQNNPNLNLRGNGVLVGFVDTGIDYTHPAFLYEDGTTKIKYIWDQTVFTGNPPDDFKYGTEYSDSQINKALASEKPFDIVPSIDKIGHGTFLAGVVSGREQGKYQGVAPDSEILCVKLASAKKYARENSMIFTDVENVYQDTDLLMGLFYLINKAKELGRPLSITIGVGTTQGGHDGYTYFPITGTTRGVVTSSACGNEGNSKSHASGKINNTGDTYALELNIGENELGCAVYIWGYAPDKMSISLTSPSGEYIEKMYVRNTTHEKFRLVFYDTTIWVTYFIAVDRNGDQLSVIRLKNPEPGTWKIMLFGDSIVNGSFHAWLLPKGWISKDTYFLSSNPSSTITEIANSTSLISVSAYNQVDQHTFIESSRGPSRHGAIRPDIMAPGVKVAGPLPGKSYGTQSGTSVAAAHVAGAAALLLEWGIIKGNYKQMNTQIVRSMLIAGAKRRVGTIYPNDQNGYGQLDLLGTFRVMNTIVSKENFSFYLEDDDLASLKKPATKNTSAMVWKPFPKTELK